MLPPHGLLAQQADLPGLHPASGEEALSLLRSQELQSLLASLLHHSPVFRQPSELQVYLRHPHELSVYFDNMWYM